MKSVLWPAIGLALLCSSPAAADPIRVTSGTITLTDEPGEFHVTGSGFDVTLEWFPILQSGTFWFNHCSSEFRCSPGSTIDFTATYGFGDGDQGFGGTVNGVRYLRLFTVGTLAFQGPEISIPSHLDMGQSVTLRGPFAFQGKISVFADEARTSPSVFTGELTGRGTAAALGHSGTGLGVRFHDLVYSFASPVPEPSTLLLLISGTVTGTMVRRRRAH